jgi:hypothetical protein
MAAVDRRAIALAAETLDAELALDPEFVGDEAQFDYREVVVGPIQVLFEILPDDRLVRVLGVKLAASP